jgi:hypothetical protein
MLYTINSWCPSCGAYLYDQDGFKLDGSLESWTCTECGTVVYASDYENTYVDYESDDDGESDDDDEFDDDDESDDDDEYDDYLLREIEKDTIKKLLKIEKKKGEITTFDIIENSIPLVCYHINKIFGGFISDDESSDADYDEDDKDIDYNNTDNETNINDKLMESPNNVFLQYFLMKNEKMYRIKNRVLVISLIILALGIFGGYKYIEYKKSIVVGVSSSDILGSNYEDIVEQLKGTGFTCVTTIAEGDLSIQEIDKEYEISSITIGKKDSFQAADKFPYDSKVIVSYHSVKNIEIPVSYNSVKDMSYSELETILTDAGFINIITEKDTDLITGWISKENSIKKVTVNGEEKFKENDTFRPDVEIIITYHAFKE